MAVFLNANIADNTVFSDIACIWNKSSFNSSYDKGTGTRLFRMVPTDETASIHCT